MEQLLKMIYSDNIINPFEINPALHPRAHTSIKQRVRAYSNTGKASFTRMLYI